MWSKFGWLALCPPLQPWEYCNSLSSTWAKRTLLTSFTGIWKRGPESVGWLGPTACGLPTSISKTLLLPTADGRPQLTRPIGMQTFSLPPASSLTTKRPGLLFAPSCQVYLPFPFPAAVDRCAQLMQSSVRKLAKKQSSSRLESQSFSRLYRKVNQWSGFECWVFWYQCFFTSGPAWCTIWGASWTHSSCWKSPF